MEILHVTSNILYIDTSDLNASVCGYQNTLGTTITIIEDSAANLVNCIKEILVSEKPDRILWVSGPGSYTGLRIGWCVVRLLSMIWDCKIWSVKKPSKIKSLRDIECLEFNNIGPVYL